MTATQRPGAALAAPRHLLLFAWAFGFFAVAGTTVLSWDPVARAVAVALYGVPVIAWAILRRDERLDRLDVAVLGGVAAHIVVSFAGVDPRAGLEMSSAVVAYAATYLAARTFGSNPAIRRLVTLAVTGSLLLWLAVLAVTWIAEQLIDLQRLGPPPDLVAHQPWVWGSVNTPPVLVLLVAPFVAGLPASRMRRAAVVVLAACALVVVPLSVGRAGWLGLAVAALSSEVLLGFPLLRHMGISARRAARLMVAIATAFVALIGLLGVAGRLAPIVGELDSRLRLWDQGIRLFLADPITGAGPSAFPWARLSQVADYADRVAARDAHSVPVQTLSDGGVLLGLAAVLIVGAWGSLVFRGRHRLTIPQRLALAALAGYAAFALLDDLAFLPAITVALIILAAWAIPDAPAEASVTRPDRSPFPRWAIPFTLIVASVVTAPAVVAMTAARAAARDGRAAAIDGAWTAAQTSFEDAAGWHPEDAQLWMSAGLVAARGGDRSSAVAAYDRARDISPGDPRPLGAIASLEADPETAIQLLDSAVRRSNDPRYAYRLGTALLDLGDRDAAARAFAISAVLWPDWWSVIPHELWFDVEASVPGAISLVGPVAGRDPHEALWTAGLALGELPDDAPLPWVAVSTAAAGDLTAARALLDRAPSEARTDLAAAAIARLACDEAGHDRAMSRLAHRPAATLQGDHPVRIGRSGLYRDLELGDYQPIAGRSVPEAPPWPYGLIEVPDCGW